MKAMILVIGVLMLASGCANLGDGKIAGTVDMEALANAADAAAPGMGYGDKIRTSEAALQNAMGKTPPGPFGSLPYSTERTGTLKDGTQFTEGDIADLRETLTPVVPAAIVRQISPATLWTPAPVPVADTNAPAVTE